MTQLCEINLDNFRPTTLRAMYADTHRTMVSLMNNPSAENFEELRQQLEQLEEIALALDCDVGDVTEQD